MRTRIQIDCVIEHDGAGLLGPIDVLDFVEGGLRRLNLDVVATAIEPGAKIALSRAKTRKAK